MCVCGGGGGTLPDLVLFVLRGREQRQGLAQLVCPVAARQLQ